MLFIFTQSCNQLIPIIISLRGRLRDSFQVSWVTGRWRSWFLAVWDQRLCCVGHAMSCVWGWPCTLPFKRSISWTSSMSLRSIQKLNFSYCKIILPYKFIIISLLISCFAVQLPLLARKHAFFLTFLSFLPLAPKLMNDPVAIRASLLSWCLVTGDWLLSSLDSLPLPSALMPSPCPKATKASGEEMGQSGRKLGTL